jgi:hypothetical protein
LSVKEYSVPFKITLLIFPKDTILPVPTPKTKSFDAFSKIVFQMIILETPPEGPIL